MDFQIKDIIPNLASALIFMIMTLFISGIWFTDHSMSIVWPVSGVALVIISRYGNSLFPGFFLGAFAGKVLANIIIEKAHPGGSVLITAAVLASFYVVEVWAGYFLLRYFDLSSDYLSFVKGITVFILISFTMSLVFSLLLLLSFLILSLLSIHSFSIFIPLKYFFSHFAGVLVFAPVVSVLFNGPGLPHKFTRRLELILLLGLLLMVSAVVFLKKGFPGLTIPPYFVIPVLIWITVRFGQAVGIISVFLVACFAVYSGGAGLLWPYSGSSTGSVLMMLQGFVSVNALIVLFLGAVEIQKKAALKELEENIKKVRKRYSFVRTLHNSLDISKVGENLIDFLSSIYAPDFVSMFLFDSEKDEFSLVAQRGFDPQISRNLKVIPIKGTFSRITLDKGSLSILNGLENDQRLSDQIRGFLSQMKVQTVVSIPVMIRGHALGVINMLFQAERTISKSEQEYLVSLSSEVGMAVSNAINHESAMNELEERKRVEEELRERENYLEMIIQGAGLITWDWDLLEDRIICRDSASGELNLTEDLLDTDLDQWLSRVHPDDMNKAQGILRYHLGGKSDSYKLQYRIPNSSGDWKWVFEAGFVLKRDEQDVPVRSGGILMDVSNEREKEIKFLDMQKRFRLFMDVFPGAVYIKDSRDLSIIFANDYMKKFMGQNDIEGKTPEELLPSDSAALIREDDREVLEAGFAEKMEKLCDAGGERRYFETRKFRIESNNSEYPMLGGVSFDVTEQYVAEKSLQESEQKLNSIFRATPSGLGLARKRDLYYVNQGLCDLLGRSEDELTGCNSRILYPDEKEYERVGSTIYREMREKGSSRIETVFMTSDERVLDILLSTAPIDPSDQSKGIAFTCMDISERKKAERDLLESELKFRLLFESAPIAMARVGIDYRFLEVNDSFRKMLGYDDEDVKQLKIKDITAPESLKDNYLKQSQLARGEIDHFQMEKIFISKEGKLLKGLLSATAVRDEEGKTSYFLGQIVDVSDLKKAQEQLRDLNNSLEERVANRTHQLQLLNKELESFNYSVSHDLRAPLRGIDGFSLAVIEDYGERLPEEGIEYLNRVRKATAKMGQLIDDLLRLSRISRKDINFKDLDISTMACEVLEDFRERDPSRDVDTKIAPGMTAYGDEGLIRVVLENLLGNAWKFTAMKKDAKIEFYQDDEGLFVLRDNGAGFDQKYAHKLFDVFQRLHNSTEFQGNGVGLSTVLRIINRHGGEIRGEGVRGKGAAFYFRINKYIEGRN